MVRMTVGVEGMMCAMCEAHVCSAIRDKFKVNKVTASKGKGLCVVTAEEPIDERMLRAAINATGYRTTSYAVEQVEAKKGFLSRFFG